MRTGRIRQTKIGNKPRSQIYQTVIQKKKDKTEIMKTHKSKIDNFSGTKKKCRDERGKLRRHRSTITLLK